MQKIISNKEHVKELFQSIGYFVFIAGLLKLALENIDEATIFYRLAVVFIFLLLTVIALFYGMYHVLGPITKEYYPNFKTPFIDPSYHPPKNLNEISKRKGLILWFMMGVPYYLIGIHIIGLGFN